MEDTLSSTSPLKQALLLADKNIEEAYLLLNLVKSDSLSEQEAACKEFISGKYFVEKENFPEALPFLASALHRLEGLPKEVSLYKQAGEQLVRIYRKIGDSPYAAALLRSSIEHLEKTGNDKLTLSLFHTLGEIYMSTHNFPEALRNFKILYRKAALYGDTVMMSEALFKIGNTYNWDEKLKDAEEHLLQAKEMKLKEGHDPSWVIASLGILYTKTEAFDLSLKHFEECLELCKQNGDAALQCNVMKSMGNLYNLIGEPDMAISILNKAMLIASAIPHKTVMMLCHQFLADAYEKKKDFGPALRHYKQYFLLNEEIKKSSTDVQLKGMQLKYDVDEARKESEIYKLKNIDLANANREIEIQKKEITGSIRYAERIQRAILPPGKIFNQHLDEHFVLFLPKDIVSGDFYWAAEYGSKFIFAVVDCTGHGVPGAFLSMIAYNLLNQAVNELGISSPDAILQYMHKGINKAFLNVNDSLSETSVKDSMDMAICAYDRSARQLEYAGVMNPLYFIRKGELQEVKGDKVHLGNGTEMKFTNHLFTIEKGDAFYIFSDGYADQFGGPLGKKFKYRQIKDILTSIGNTGMNDQKVTLEKKFEDWKGATEQVDDICMIGFKPMKQA